MSNPGKQPVADVINIDGISSKRCSNCGEIKPLTDFHRHRNTGAIGGRRSYCKICRNQKENMRKRGNTKNKERSKLWRLTEKEKYKAVSMLNNAIAQGLITRPTICEICGEESRDIIGHHTDYSLPYNVHWLCRACHGFVHSQEFNNPNILNRR